MTKTLSLKKRLSLVLLTAMLSCTSVQKHNSRLDTPLEPFQLHQDVEYALEQLEKLHPELYGYTPKETFYFKKDSLIETLNRPLTPREFYFRLAPLITEVRQGHLQLQPAQRRYTIKESKALKNKKGLLSEFSYQVKDGRIYIKAVKDPSLAHYSQSELTQIEGKSASELLQSYSRLVSRDGYNTTFLPYALARRWPVYYTAEHSLNDSLQLTLKRNDSLQQLTLVRAPKTPQDLKEDQQEKKKKAAEKTRDYNPVTKSYNRTLEYLDADRKVALLKIRSFSYRGARSFYKSSFQELKDNRTEHLILDLRNNLGGSLAEIHDLYSYVSLEQRFKLIEPIELNSRSSLLHSSYQRLFPKVLRPVMWTFYIPYRLGSYLLVRKHQDRYVLSSTYWTYPKKPKKTAYTKSLYVLVNGSSFSAASTLASKLQSAGRAEILGEETGGAAKWAVAGQYAVKQLPHSRLLLPIGLMKVTSYTHGKEHRKGHGVDPDLNLPTDSLLPGTSRDAAVDRILKRISRLKTQR